MEDSTRKPLYRMSTDELVEIAKGSRDHLFSGPYEQAAARTMARTQLVMRAQIAAQRASHNLPHAVANPERG